MLCSKLFKSAQKSRHVSTQTTPMGFIRGTFTAAFIAFTASNIAVILAGPITPVVDLGYATYEGTFNVTTKRTEFLSVRYAAPPTGTLRWQPPQPPKATPGVQKANSKPPTCYTAGQGNAPATPFRPDRLSMRDTFLPSEDCLFLNVYVPGDLSDNRRKLPVVFWIHGGGYVAGSASGFQGTDIYDGNDLIRESNEGVVVVVVQYRLGLFGFLPGAAVKRNGALNAGLLDQQFALRWVQKHISKFGGDPTRVTIWGESAGAGSVLQHIIANGGKTTPPLFRGAITSSSFLPSQYRYNDRIPEILYREAVSQTNCAKSLDTLACLRGVDIDTLEAANTKINNSGFFGTFVFVPVIDGDLIRERPIEALRKRKVNGNALLAVTNTFEGALFIDQTTPANVDVPNYLAQLFPNFGQNQITAAAVHYQNLGSPIFQITAIMGESIFICPTYYLLKAFPGRAFKSEFAIPPGGHGNDVAYYFPSMNPGGIPPFNNAAFGKAFSESFLDFALSLDPNVKSDPAGTITPTWKKWAGEVEMLFNRTEAGDPDVRPIKTSSALLDRCKFWESVGTVTGQ
ncbi:hypothetical protein Hypma_003046 [Hypsizygus marmoreus]|uniref:Carboxylic ester hydrolase n=1 Tax=Hypsizygus marmoreus TaxID=39966 RepID=A0A369J956_HYPMA|nr:hypothetical protein Hypma_003046 [Hypsizygus marmoreus]